MTPTIDRQRLVNLLASSDRFRRDMESSLEMGYDTLQTINDILMPLQPFFDRAERGEYPLDTMKDADLRALSEAILPLRYERADYRLVSLSEPFPRPQCMTQEYYDAHFTSFNGRWFLRNNCWRSFCDELHDGWDPVIWSRLPHGVTIEAVGTEVRRALCMDTPSEDGCLVNDIWRWIEAPLTLYVGAALGRNDSVMRNFAALLPHLLKILPIGAMPGPGLYGGPLLCAVA